MKLTTATRGRFQVISVLDDITLNTETAPLIRAVESSLADGNTHIAVSFGDNSFLYTRHIASLVRCLELIRERGGSLAVIHPNRDIIDVLMLIDPEQMIIKAESEEELLLATNKP